MVAMEVRCPISVSARADCKQLLTSSSASVTTEPLSVCPLSFSIASFIPSLVPTSTTLKRLVHSFFQIADGSKNYPLPRPSTSAYVGSSEGRTKSFKSFEESSQGSVLK